MNDVRKLLDEARTLLIGVKITHAAIKNRQSDPKLPIRLKKLAVKVRALQARWDKVVEVDRKYFEKLIKQMDLD